MTDVAITKQQPVDAYETEVMNGLHNRDAAALQYAVDARRDQRQDVMHMGDIGVFAGDDTPDIACGARVMEGRQDGGEASQD